MAVEVRIPALGDKFQDYRQDIPGDSFNWGPTIKSTDIDAFTFHHSVTKQTAKVDGNWKKECDTIANLHLSRGWDGVGYRFIICSDGTVAYVGDLSHGGSGVLNNNDHVFSACFIGDFTKELPTAAQINSAHMLAKHFLTEMPAYPNLSTWDQIKGHQDFIPTACPGSNWRSSGGLRDRIVNNIFQGYPDPQPAGAQPEPQPEPVPTPPATDWEKVAKEHEEKIKQQATVIDNLNQQINDRNNDIVQLNARISTLDSQVLELTQKANSLEEQAKRVPELEKLANEYEEYRVRCSEQEKTHNRTVAQLRAEIERLKKNAVRTLALSILEKLGLK